MNGNHHGLPHHFTASGIVIFNHHILLVHHNRIGAWVPPGGHIEQDEMPEETVVREIEEETGIRVDVLSEPLPPVGDADAFFLATPLYVQSVLAIEGGQRFYHVDLAYLCRPSTDTPLDDRGFPRLLNNHEVKDARWVNMDAASELPLAKNVIEALDLVKNESRIARFNRRMSHSGDLDKPIR